MKKIGIVLLLAALAVTGLSCGSNAATDNLYNGIAPPSYYADNFYPGAHGERPLIISNSDDWTKYYIVAYCYPDNIDASKGYGYPPIPAQDWVTMNGELVETTVEVPGRSQVEVPIELWIPEGAMVPNQKWEFWISATELNQEGMVHLRYCQRWLVTMKE